MEGRGVTQSWRYPCVTRRRGGKESEKLENKINTTCCTNIQTSESRNCQAHLKQKKKNSWCVLLVSHTDTNQYAPYCLHMFCHHGVTVAMSTQSNAARQMLAVSITARSDDNNAKPGVVTSSVTHVTHNSHKWNDWTAGEPLVIQMPRWSGPKILE